MAYIEDEYVGSLEITATPQGINACTFSSLGSFEKRLLDQKDCLDVDAALILSNAISQVNAYLKGRLTSFNVPLDWSDISAFAQKVYKATMQIPFGEVRTYGEIAIAIGQGNAARAVGAALGANPFVLLVPCHRVIGANGHLNGFSAPGGLETKSRLLRHEGHSIQENRLS